MKKWPELLFACLCLIICAALSLGMLIFGPAEAAANERLASKPQLIRREEWNPDYLSDLAQYVSDRFFLRQELITARGKAASMLGSSTVEDVILGKDGWLYYAPTLADYCGTEGLSDGELAAAAGNLALMREYCERIGAKFLFVSAPNKNTLYPMAMPGYRAAETHDIHRLFPLLEAEGVPYADLYAAFAAQPEVLYFAHDSHWNSRGAALAADVIDACFGRSSTWFSAPFDGAVRHDGDLYEMLYPAAEDPETDPVCGRALRYTRQGSDTRPDSITINTVNAAGEGTLLAFRDSFGNSLYPYLADSFAVARFSRLTAYDLVLAEELGADCVMVELVERNLRYLLQNVPVMPAPERVLPGPAQKDGELILTRKEGGRTPAGCVLLRGTLEEGTAGRVYLSAGSRCWEAFALEEGGFAAYLPADELPDTVWIQREQALAAFAVAAVTEE